MYIAIWSPTMPNIERQTCGLIDCLSQPTVVELAVAVRIQIYWVSAAVVTLVYVDIAVILI
jgi:hypothetical protein